MRPALSRIGQRRPIRPAGRAVPSLARAFAGEAPIHLLAPAGALVVVASFTLAYVIALTSGGPDAVVLLGAPLYAAALLLSGGPALVAGALVVAFTVPLLGPPGLPLVAIPGFREVLTIVVSAVALRAVVVLAVTARTDDLRHETRLAEQRAAQLDVLQAASARLSRAGDRRGGRADDRRGDAAGSSTTTTPGSTCVEPADDVVPIAFEGRVGAYEQVDFDLLALQARRGLHRLGRRSTASRSSSTTRTAIRAARRSPGPTTSTSRCSSCRCATTASTVGVITLSKLGLDGFDADDLRLLHDPRRPGRDRGRVGPPADPQPGPRRRAAPAARHERRAVGAASTRARSPNLMAAPPRRARWASTSARSATGTGRRAGSSRSATTRRRRLEELRAVLRRRRLPGDAARPRAPGDRRSSTPTTRPPTRPRSSCCASDGNRVLVDAAARRQGPVDRARRADLAGRRSRLDDERLELARTMANEAAMALENARLYEDARNARRPRPADRLLQPPLPARAARRGGRPRPARRGGR